MRDRQPTKPGRVLIAPENGTTPFYATITRADEPTDTGTPINKASLLQDETAEMLGLDPADDPTVDDAFRLFSGHITFATLHIFSPIGSIITVYGEGMSKNIVSAGEDDIGVPGNGIYSVTRNINGKIETREVEVTERGSLVPVVLSWRYGFRKKKSENDPYTRIEYLYDAVGMAPAHMNFDKGEFDYGDWGIAWFVRKNRPIMQKADLTEDYELDHNDHTKKLDGTPSDVSNTDYDGNAMSAIPLCWFYRYEDNTYEYEIVCEHQWDERYKAYAHTDADGNIMDYFTWWMFGGSRDSTKRIRSLKDQNLAMSLKVTTMIDGATANGPGWYIHSCSRRSCIISLLILMAKSTDTQTAYGNGDNRGAGGSSGRLLTTGTLSDKGQFFGYSSNNQQVKVFYIEGFWGDQSLRTAGIINNNGRIYYKMTPEGDGYRVDDVEGYTDSESKLPASNGFISATKCGEFGCIPIASNGSKTTFECDMVMVQNPTTLPYLLAGSSSYYGNGSAGAFAFRVDQSASFVYWNLGCGLSADMPNLCISSAEGPAGAGGAAQYLLPRSPPHLCHPRSGQRGGCQNLVWDIGPHRRLIYAEYLHPRYN